MDRTIVTDAHTTIATMTGATEHSKVTLATKTIRSIVFADHFRWGIGNRTFPGLELGGEGKCFEKLISKDRVFRYPPLVRIDRRDP